MVKYHPIPNKDLRPKSVRMLDPDYKKKHRKQVIRNIIFYGVILAYIGGFIWGVINYGWLKAIAGAIGVFLAFCVALEIIMEILARLFHW